MYNIIPLGVIIVSLAVIFFIIARKFPMLSSLDVDIDEGSKQNKLKERIILERIKKRLTAWKRPKFLAKYQNAVARIFKDKYSRLVNLEKKFELNKFTSHRLKATKSGVEKILEEGLRLLESNDFYRAEKKFLEVIKKDNRNIEAYEGLARIYLRYKQTSEAKEILNYILKIDPSNRFALFKLGDIYKEEGNYEMARESYLKLWRTKRGDGEVLLSLAEVCEALDYKEEALSHLKEAVNLNPNNPRYLDRLIKVSLLLKDRSLAHYALEQLKEINPHNKNIEIYKKQIKDI